METVLQLASAPEKLADSNTKHHRGFTYKAYTFDRVSDAKSFITIVEVVFGDLKAP